VVAVVVVLVGGAVFGGAVFGFGLGDSGERASGTPTVAPETAVDTPTVKSTATGTVVPTPTPTSTVAPTPTATPTVVATPFPVPSATVTPTPTATPAYQAYSEFINTFLGEMAAEASVPVRSRGGVMVDGEMWYVVNATAKSVNDTRRVKEWGALVTGYIRAYQFHKEGDIGGKLPTGMRILEVNNTDRPPKTLFLSNLVAERVHSGDIQGPELVESYYSTIRNQTAREQVIALENDKEGINATYGPNGNITRTE
jgi:hypothetical protein